MDRLVCLLESVETSIIKAEDLPILFEDSNWFHIFGPNFA